MMNGKNYVIEYADLMRTIYRTEPAAAILLLNDFYKKYADQDANGELKTNTTSSIGNILYQNGDFKEALIIYKELMQNSLRESILYTSFLEKVVDILIRLNKKNEAFCLLEDYLNKTQISWNNTFILLKLLLENKEFKRLEKFKAHIDWVAKELGLEISHIDVMHDVEYLVKEHSEASLRHMIFSVAYSKVSDQDRIEVLEKYIAKENVNFYKNIAVKKLAELITN